VPDALLIMAKAYRFMDLDDLSADALRVLELNYPGHDGIGELRSAKTN
jgi:outer membrane protein assembly factor BamD